MSIEKKIELIDQMKDILGREHRTIKASADAASDEATHEESRPENKYDTRGLEASYLAGAQSARAAELEAMLEHLGRVVCRAFSNLDKIAPMAVVEVEHDEKVSLFFVVHAGAGLILKYDERTVVTVSIQSPMGRALLGKGVGDLISITTSVGTKDYEVISVG